MNRFLVLGVITAGMWAAVPGTTHADQIFDFSFTNTLGDTPGTVTGTVDIPFAGNGTGAATNVTITSYPGAVGNVGTPPIDVTSWSTQLTNSFTVTGGNITSVFYEALGSGLPDTGLFQLLTPNGELLDASTGHFVEGPVTFTPAVASPEPGTITLLGTGLLALGGLVVGRRRKKLPGIDPPST